MIYNCKIVNDYGSVIEKRIDVKNIQELKESLAQQKHRLLSYKKSNFFKNISLSKNKILLFTLTIKLLLTSNLSIIDSLEIALKTFKDNSLRLFTESTIRKLKRGDSFSVILRESCVGFSSLYLGLIEVGEQSGNLTLILEQLYIYLERSKKLRDKIIGALIYPIFILVITILFSIIFVIIVLPQFNEMFSSMGGGLGNILTNRSSILKIVILIFISIIFVVSTIILYTSRIKKIDTSRSIKVESLYIKLPYIGKIILEKESFNLVFALSILTKSSVNIEKSLEFSQEVISNSCLKNELIDIRKGVISGKTLSFAFSESMFPDKIESFINVGEKTGDISVIFNDLSKYFLKESEKRIERFMSILDPIFTLILGGILFFLILLFILPVLTHMGTLL